MAKKFSRFLLALPALLGATLATLLASLAIAAMDLLWLILGRKQRTADTLAARTAASLVIPNWNGRDLLERFLPSWLAAIENHPGSEVLIVDNGSTDGSADWIRANYPQVHLLALPQNLGFGAGSNAGFHAAKNDIVVLLNSDMRVEPDFLAPLLSGFTDDKVFAVSCQIFLGDPTKRREETGLTEARWRDGNLQVAHREDPAVDRLFPCFYGGGGSCAFDRRKFLELGGFDELLRPFDLEDTDLGFLAWKRGWKVLYQPASIVHHEHRGTIGKKFTQRYIGQVLSKNFVLFAWKNIHEPGPPCQPLLFLPRRAARIGAWSGPAPGRANAGGILRALLQLPGALRSRWRARSLAVVSDAEAFRRPRPSYFHDRFSHFDPRPARPRCSSSPLTPSPRPPTAAASLCTTCCVNSPAGAKSTSLSCSTPKASVPPRTSCASSAHLSTRSVRTVSREPHLASITPHAVQEFHTVKPNGWWSAKPCCTAST